MNVNVRAEGLQSYHYVWLTNHPWRSESWLKERLQDGFHIHHLDGNHDNDEPSNLVLIDGVDHMRLHGMKLLKGIQQWKAKRRAPPKPAAPTKSKTKASEIYLMKAEVGGSWVEFAKVYYSGVKPTHGAWHDIGARLSMRARKFAAENGLPWPPSK